MAAHNAAARIAAAQRTHDVAWDEEQTGNARAEQTILEQTVPEQITWGELGCPGKIGLYRFRREAIRVKNIHIIVAENDPAALFTVVTLRPPLGPPEYMLGHRVA
ncbi:MAG: hypothetical protein ACRECO_04385 [Xanthobacteraceae bacterium]